MPFPMILLQKPSCRSKAKDNSMSLLRRIEWFQNGNFDRLLAECREIQRNLKLRRSSDQTSPKHLPKELFYRYPMKLSKP